MALPLPEGKKIHITYRMMNSDYEMPSLEAAPDHYSLGFIIHGDRRVITPTLTFELHAGFVSAMPPFLYHRTVPASDEYYESILIKFSPDLVEEMNIKLGSAFLDKFYENPPKSFSDTQAQERIFNVARDMYRIYEKGDTDTERLEFRLRCILLGLLFDIYEESTCSDGVNNHQTELSQPIIEAVYYIEKNYMKPVKIEDAASAGGYSVSYFSRLFRAQLGLSFSDYLQNIRLKHVKSDLISTGKSIMDIAIDNGFEYPGNMSSCFRKKMGMTPSRFRKQMIR